MMRRKGVNRGVDEEAASAFKLTRSRKMEPKARANRGRKRLVPQSQSWQQKICRKNHPNQRLLFSVVINKVVKIPYKARSIPATPSQSHPYRVSNHPESIPRSPTP